MPQFAGASARLNCSSVTLTTTTCVILKYYAAGLSHPTGVSRRPAKTIE